MTPWSMKARASREARAETSSGPIWASEEATAAYDTRAVPSRSTISSKAASVSPRADAP